MSEKNVDLVIIGGGPAGLAAAVAAREAGVEDIVILERDIRLGGILNQCIHNGFGLHTFKEELTGPEYANRYIRQVMDLKIPYLLGTIVVDISVEEGQAGDHGIVRKRVTAMNKTEGLFTLRAGAVILAMGCRERSRGALNIPGYRPAGIYSAGTAQHYVNMEGRMPGKEVVILGSGDIGLIMARRMTLEGAKVKVVAELMPYSGGLKRNIVQCLDDYGIPLKLSHTVVDIRGKERVEGVTIAQVDEHLKPIPGTEEDYSCDTLLLSCGLIPENELSRQLGVQMNPVTSGPVVNESLETNVPGVYACGNVLHVHDLVDYVSGEAAMAGQNAAAQLLKNTAAENTAAKNTAAKNTAVENTAREIRIVPDGKVRYTVPSLLHIDRMRDTLTVRFRVGAIFRDKQLAVYCGDQLLSRQAKRVMAPGEMEQVILVKKKLQEMGTFDTISVKVED